MLHNPPRNKLFSPRLPWGHFPIPFTWFYFLLKQMEPQKNEKACDNVICRSGERKCSRFIWANSNSLKRLKNNLLAACSHSWTLVCLQDVGISFSSVFFLSFKWLLNQCERFYPCNNLGFFWSIAGCGRTCVFHLFLSSREETILAWASKLRVTWHERWDERNQTRTSIYHVNEFTRQRDPWNLSERGE